MGLEDLLSAAGRARDPSSFAPVVLGYIADATAASVVALSLEEADELPSLHHRADGALTLDHLKIVRGRIDGSLPAGSALVHRATAGTGTCTLYVDPAPEDATVLEPALTLIGLLAELAIARREAAVDPLTMLHNRRSMLRSLNRLIAEGNRYEGRMFSCVMIDLNNFKWFNDVYGHPIGDELLRALANVLRTTVRESDLAARWGGDEFLLVLPQTDADAAAVILDRITVDLEDFLGHYRRDEVHLGYSAGISYFPSDGRDVDTLIRAADDRLYETKRRLPLPDARR